MTELQEELKEISKKYNLNFEYFKIFKKKKFLINEVIIYYGTNQYFFKIKEIISLKSYRYFPYFEGGKGSSLDDWGKSIKSILLRKGQLLTTISDGKKLRDQFKKKNNV